MELASVNRIHHFVVLIYLYGDLIFVYVNYLATFPLQSKLVVMYARLTVSSLLGIAFNLIVLDKIVFTKKKKAINSTEDWHLFARLIRFYICLKKQKQNSLQYNSLPNNNRFNLWHVHMHYDYLLKWTIVS